jgi:anti-sigma regulatory factor (Ser/Thr protein kinase)
MSPSHLIHISDPTRPGLARREAAAIVRNLGFNEEQTGIASLVVTEMATNLLKHAIGGRIILRPLNENGHTGIELLAVDQGPGIQDINRCMTDGFSTAGSPGTGLGAIVRMSSVFDIFSQPGRGTVLLSQIWAQGAPPESQVVVGAVCLPKPAEQACGDAWHRISGEHAQRVLVVDGLGHGPLAQQAAHEAVRVVQANPATGLKDLLKDLHAELRPTRGASLAVCDLKPAEQQVHFAGVGNISGVVLNHQGTRSMISHNGTVGHEVHKIQDYSYPWDKEAVVLLHSDGMSTRWRMDSYPGLLSRHPSLIAGVLYRDFRRDHDDFTVVIIKRPS